MCLSINELIRIIQRYKLTLCFFIIFLFNLIILNIIVNQLVNTKNPILLKSAKNLILVKQNKIDCSLAIITTWKPAYLEINTKAYISYFSRYFVYALYDNALFMQNNCSFHVYSLIHFNESEEYDYYASFVTPIYVDNQPFSRAITKLARLIHLKNFSHVIMHVHKDITPNQWQLVDMGINLNKLNRNIFIYYVIHSALIYPDLETISLIRHMSHNAAYLIVMSWHFYHSLIHAYGIEESKLVYIPHGINFLYEDFEIEKVNLTNILSKFASNDKIILSTGYIYSHKGLERMIRTLKNASQEIPDLKYLIVGKELINDHKNRKSMISLNKYINSYNLSDKIIWIDKFLSATELYALNSKVNAYASLFDETHDCSVSSLLLNAMASKLPIISTSNCFAQETLQNNRGILVPFNDDTNFINSLIKLFKNETKMKNYGQQSYKYVRKQSWSNVVELYMKLIKKGQLADLNSRQMFNFEIHNDPFMKNDWNIDSSKAIWSTDYVRTFDDQNLQTYLRQANASIGIYTIYSDSSIQMNAKLNIDYKIETLALRASDNYVLVDLLSHSIDEYHNRYKNDKSIVSINYKTNQIFVKSTSVNFVIQLQKNQILIKFLKLNKFAHPFGLIGSTANKPTKFIFLNDWLINDNKNLFSHFSSGQHWSNFEINSNVFEKLDENYLFSLKEFAKLNLIIEGPCFGNSGFAIVNRRLYLSLLNNANLNVYLKCDENEKPMGEDEKSIEILIAYNFYACQLRFQKTLQNLVININETQRENATFIFRNSYPPIFGPFRKNNFLIMHQPWEYQAIPAKWLDYIKNTITELWVPSEYCKNSFISNGLSSYENKIQVIPHGVYFEKFQTVTDKFYLPTNKTFKFLTIAGISTRKGIDILLEAYQKLFTINDNVTLIILSIYTFYSNDSFIKEFQRKSKAPEIIHLKFPLSELELIKLYKSVDVYVAPYRSEGFGLTIIEAMAAGIPVIVTRYAASLDFCTEESVYFVDAIETDCLIYPCGNKTIFNHKTVIQPKWAEPNVSSLAEAMLTAYQNPRLSMMKKLHAKSIAKQMTWKSVANNVLKRLFKILEKSSLKNA